MDPQVCSVDEDTVADEHVDAKVAAAFLNRTVLRTPAPRAAQLQRGRPPFPSSTTPQLPWYRSLMCGEEH